MRRSIIISSLSAALIFAYCSTSKHSQNSTANAGTVTYTTNVQPIIASNCSPCHIPPKGQKKAYDNYAAVKTDIDEILTRIQKNPDEKGFMPARHPKLPDSTIQVLAQWKKDGLSK
jgi:hypothetical protein